MARCPKCNAELEDDMTQCIFCGADLDDDQGEWVLIGFIDDKISADLAEETLKSCNIPGVVFSRSGFFGKAGLPLNSFYDGDNPLFEVSVPIEYYDDAVATLEAVLGDKWRIKEN